MQSKCICQLTDLPQTKQQNQLVRSGSHGKASTDYQCIFFLTIGRSYHSEERLGQARTRIRTNYVSELNDLEGRAMRYVHNDH